MKLIKRTKTKTHKMINDGNGKEEKKRRVTWYKSGLEKKNWEEKKTKNRLSNFDEKYVVALDFIYYFLVLKKRKSAYNLFNSLLGERIFNSGLKQ